MKLHALTTGAVRVKHSFLFPSPGPRRQLALFMPGAFSDPLPIHCWAIEHQGVLRLVDSGETAAARDVPFARMEVTREQELPAALAAAGLKLDDVTEVVLTHAHGDHIDGLIHLRARVLINETELRSARSPIARVMRRVLRQPLPPGFAPETFVLDGGPFGAFPRSRTLSDDGRIIAVETPGHTQATYPSSASTTQADTSCSPVTQPTPSNNSTHDAPTPPDRTPKPISQPSTRFSLTAHTIRRSTSPPTTQTQQPGSQPPQRCSHGNQSIQITPLASCALVRASLFPEDPLDESPALVRSVRTRWETP